jgi:hypothetical protein
VDAPAGGTSTSYASIAPNRSLRHQASVDGSSAAVSSSRFQRSSDNGYAAAAAAAAKEAALADLHDMQAMQRRATGRSAVSSRSAGGARRGTGGGTMGAHDDGPEGAEHSSPSWSNLMGFKMPGTSQRKSLDVTRAVSQGPSHNPSRSVSRAASRRSLDLATLGQHRRRNSLDVSSAGNLGAGPTLSTQNSQGAGIGRKAGRSSIDATTAGKQAPKEHVPGLRTRRWVA